MAPFNKGVKEKMLSVKSRITKFERQKTKSIYSVVLALTCKIIMAHQ